MRNLFNRYRVISVLTLLLLTAGVKCAKADSVALSDGNNVSGTMILSVNIAGFVNLDTADSWKFTSTVVPFPNSTPLGATPSWSNTDNLGLAPANLTGPLGAYTILTITNNNLDSTGSGKQSQLSFAVAGTFSQFEALLNGLAVGQSTQLSLLTVNGGGCSLGACSQETDSDVLDGTLLGQQSEYIVGPAFITITNDPGLYDVTLTSTPLNPPTNAPEPASLVLLGIGLSGLVLSFCIRASSHRCHLRCGELGIS